MTLLFLLTIIHILSFVSCLSRIALIAIESGHSSGPLHSHGWSNTVSSTHLCPQPLFLRADHSIQCFLIWIYIYDECASSVTKYPPLMWTLWVACHGSTLLWGF